MPDKARTLVYVHGIGPKPAPSVLKKEWDQALFGFDAGERTRFAFWARETSPGMESRWFEPRLLEDPLREPGDATASLVRSGVIESRHEGLFRGLEERILALESATPTTGFGSQIVPVAPLRRALMRVLLPFFLRDVNDFLFVPSRREAMRKSLFDRLSPGGGPFVIVGHSLGSAIAYDVLRDVGRDVAVPLFVTLGSPLGLDEIQDGLGGKETLRVPVCVSSWLNVAGTLDVVSLDPTLRNDFGDDPRIRDLVVGLGGDMHEATSYLSEEDVRSAVRTSVDSSLFQFVAPVTMMRDLSLELEDAGERRVPVLIELASVSAGTPGIPDGVRDSVILAIRDVTGEATDGDVRLRAMKRYVSADLTRLEAETLAARLSAPPVHAPPFISKMWRNGEKRMTISSSVNTVQAATAHLGYGAEGQGIHWAVLDTGVDASHAHFAAHRTIVAQVDCTGVKTVIGAAPDPTGHGTHVAGIIAGQVATGTGSERGMAPKAALHVYRVLGTDGRGDDASIIMALDHIAEENDRCGGLAIHGVNLSLGGHFEPSVFGCGFSPVCNELRRLWRQGVVVVISAGNEGHALLLGSSSSIAANMPISIGDPANLEEAIAVGSTHKERPHLYGVSYFSSRGPTADGRHKPDLVAPGEKISSCRAGGGYTAMSGTSMAAAHVSGILAAFLSVRPEYLGFPDKVKKLLLDNCTSLGRVPEQQGSGLPNLTRMLLNT